MAVKLDPTQVRIIILLNTRYEIRVSPGLIPTLADASVEEITTLALDPSGMMLHQSGRPVVSLATILEGLLGARTWMASLMR